MADTNKSIVKFPIPSRNTEDVTPEQALEGLKGAGLAVAGGVDVGAALLAASNGGQTFKNSIVLLGDSITNQNDYEDATNFNTLNAGYFTVANIILGSPFNVVNNAGVSGENTEEILSRFDSDVAPYSPQYVMLLAGTNDLLEGKDVSVITANLTSLYDKIESIGAKCITSTVYASSTMPSESDLSELNRWIKSECDTRGYICAEFDLAITDPQSDAFPYSYADVTYDSLHLNAYGAYLCGKNLSAKLEGFVSKTTLLPSILDANNKTLNPLNKGTGGTVASGVAPDDWQTFGTVPAESSLTGSVEPQEDGSVKYKLAFTGSEAFETFSRVTCEAPVDGKSYYAIAEINCNLTDATQVALRIRNLGGSNPLVGYGNRTFADIATIPSCVIDGVIKTPVIQNTDATSLIVDVFVVCASGTAEIGRVGVIEVED